jgi:glycerophosphoryl diester phosphodiesterase
VERLRPPTPIGFAHRGGTSSRAEQNTLAAFARAVALGCGVESDVWLTADGVPVLLHRSPLARRRPVRSLQRAELPAFVPTIDDLLARCGGAVDVALDMADPRAAAAVEECARRHGAVPRLWLTYWHLDVLADWRRRWPDVRLVHPTLLLGSARRGTALLDRLAAIDVDAVNVFHRRIGHSIVDAAHARGLLVFAWGAGGRRDIERALRRGADGVFADDLHALVEAVHDRRCRSGDGVAKP